MVPRVGDLVRMIREPGVENLPVGLLVGTNDDAANWCMIQWDDGELSGVWRDEIERVECK